MTIPDKYAAVTFLTWFMGFEATTAEVVAISYRMESRSLPSPAENFCTKPYTSSSVVKMRPDPGFGAGVRLESEFVRLPGNRLAVGNTLHLPILFGVQVNKIFLQKGSRACGSHTRTYIKLTKRKKNISTNTPRPRWRRK